LANPELGAKQICPNCQAKFYDLTRRPAVCPKCATAFDPEEVVRSRRTRSRAAPDYETDDGEAKVKEADVDGAEDEEEEVDDTPELDEGAEIVPLEVDEDAEIDPGAPITPDADIGVGIEEEDVLADDDDADVPFLEDEDEDEFPDDDIEGLPGEDEEH
jgi:uncharacterized protein (TIGR02300 family)